MPGSPEIPAPEQPRGAAARVRATCASAPAAAPARLRAPTLPQERSSAPCCKPPGPRHARPAPGAHHRSPNRKERAGRPADRQSVSGARDPLAPTTSPAKWQTRAAARGDDVRDARSPSAPPRARGAARAQVPRWRPARGHDLRGWRTLLRAWVDVPGLFGQDTKVGDWRLDCS